MMKIFDQKQLGKHFQTNQLSYLFILILFLMGLIFGAIIVVTMHFTQKQDIIFYLNRYFEQMHEPLRFINHELFKSALYSHLQYLIIFFLLGLSIIGLPIIWSIVFVKGTFIGFSVGFFVYQYGFRGLLFISSALLPQYILIIPVYIFAGTIAMIFSGELLKKLSGRRLSCFTQESVLQYAILFIGLILILVIAALIEGYLTSSILQYTIELIN